MYHNFYSIWHLSTTVSLSPLMPCYSHLGPYQEDEISWFSRSAKQRRRLWLRGSCRRPGPMGGCLEAGYLCVVKCKEILSWRREQWWSRGTPVRVAAPLLSPSPPSPPRVLRRWRKGVKEEGGGRGLSLQPPLKEAQYFYSCRACVKSHSYLRIKQSNMYISNISTDESFSVQINHDDKWSKFARER